MSSAENRPSSPPATKAGDAKAGEPRQPEQIRDEIEETREQLGETVAAVAEKTDVKAQAEARKEELKEKASLKAQEARKKATENPVPMALAGVFLAGVVVGRLLSR